jgi:hypothetical protein
MRLYNRNKKSSKNLSSEKCQKRVITGINASSAELQVENVLKIGG